MAAIGCVNNDNDSGVCDDDFGTDVYGVRH
jgi:hypothetical protein